MGQPQLSPDNVSDLAVFTPRGTEWVPALCARRTTGATAAAKTSPGLAREGTCATRRFAFGTVLARTEPARCRRSQGACRLSPEGLHEVSRDFNPGRPLRVRPSLLVHATERSKDKQPGEQGHSRLIDRLRRPQFGGDGPW